MANGLPANKSINKRKRERRKKGIEQKAKRKMGQPQPSTFHSESHIPIPMMYELRGIGIDEKDLPTRSFIIFT